MNKKHYSLKRRLIGYTSIFSIILGCIFVFTAYKISLGEINEILDSQMEYLAERITHHDLHPIQSKFDKARHYHEEDMFVDVWAYEDKNYLHHENHLLVPPVSKAGFYRQKTTHGVWYAYVMPVGNYQIQVSQQEKVRQVLALELAGSMFIPYLLIMPFAIFGLILIIGRTLRPLEDLKNELTQRDSNSLTPLDNQQYPVELRATTTEINHLFERISDSQQEQKQFIADAAHELRTPITALNLQTKILLSQFPEEENLQNLSKGLARMQHLVSQLLSLAKQDASLNQIDSISKFKLNNVALNCVEQLMNLAMQKDIDLGFVRNEEIAMQSIEATVHSIVFNIIDNAIKYTPSSGMINVSVYDDDNFGYVLIEDSGPGLEPEEYDKVLKRFYRVHHHLEVGSGLGLSIVQKAIQHLNGELVLSKSAELGGLSALVKLPKILLIKTLD